MARRKPTKSRDVKQLEKTVAKLRRDLKVSQRKQSSATKKALRSTKVSVKRTVRSDPLKSFRASLRKLVNAGLLPKTTKIRYAQPSQRYTEKIAKYRGVIHGEDKTYRVSRKEAAKLRAAGQEVVGDRLVLRAEPGTRKDYKQGAIHTKPIGPQGFETIAFPVPYKDLPQWIEAAKDDAALENLKRPGDRWAFRYFGYNSIDTYSNLDELFNHLMLYEAVEQSIDEDDPASMREVYRNVEIVRVKRGKWLPKLTKAERAKRGKRKRTPAARMKARTPKRYEAQLKYDRERKRASRAALKAKGGKAYKAYLTKERQRKKRK